MTTTTETRSYRGGCHCGAVRWTLTAPPIDVLYECNCSICRRMGWQLAFAPASQFVLERGGDSLTDYQFAKKHIHHVFCKVCGIRSFARGTAPDGTETVSVNTRCIDGFDADGLRIERFDGASL